MKSLSTRLSALGISVSVLLASGAAHAYGALLRLNASNGTQDTTFGTANGFVTTSGSGDSYSSVIATPTVEYAAGAIQTGTNTTRPLVRTYLLNGALNTSWAQNGTATLPSISINPSQHAQAIVRDSSNRIIAVCDDGTNLWLVRLDTSGNPDPTYGNNTQNPGVVTPFGSFNGLALRAVGIRMLSDGRTIVVANSASGTGFSLARVNASGNADLVSTGTSFGQSATVAFATDFAIDAYDNIAITGQTSSGDFGLMTLAKDSVVPDKLDVSFTDTRHYSQYPNNHTFGASVGFNPMTGGALIAVIGIQGTAQYPVSGVRFHVRSYYNNYSSSPAWTLNGYSGIYSSGTTPQTTSPTWKVLPIKVTQSGIPGFEYYVAGTSQTTSGTNQFEIVKLDGQIDLNTGILEGDPSFGTNGEVHDPTVGANGAGLNVATSGSGSTTNDPVIAGVIY